MSSLDRQASKLSEVFSVTRSLLLSIGLFSFFANLLMLTGPLYMLQIYDRVLVSRSVPTLVALSLLVAVLFLAMGLLEFVRSRLLNRVAARVDRHLKDDAFDSLMRSAVRSPGAKSDQPLRDLGSLRQFLTSPAPFVVFDAPWTPIFLVVVFLMHWVLGLIAVLGALLLFALAVANELRTRGPLREAGQAAIAGNLLAAASVRNAEAMEAMGMEPALRRRWSQLHNNASQAQSLAADRAGAFTASTKTLRLVLQSAILGAGALLAIQQIITPGMMIAASIIMGRALAPVEQAVGQWRSFLSARAAYGRLKVLLAENPLSDRRMALPPARGAFEVQHLFAAPPGAERPVLKNVSFALEAGDALGMIGPSAAGKSTLARVLVGVWPPGSGVVRLDGADVATWNRDDLGPQLGYLPQDVELFAGKVSDNIARFRENADPAAIVQAARAAGVHDMILRLPDGYDTEIGDGGRHLSGGQLQRIALARALYGDPVLVVLDEPNSNLDSAGDEALAAAIAGMKAKGQTAIVIAHRPSAIAVVDKLLMLDGGEVRAFGPKQEVLQQVLKQGPDLATKVANLKPA